MEHLLLIEDDQALGRGITLALAAGDREPHLARTLAEGRRLFAQLPSPWLFWISICPTGTAWNC